MLIEATGPGLDGSGWQSTMRCGNSPESWVRGIATLDTATGVISMIVQLETDDEKAGPKGKLHVVVKDNRGHSIAEASTAEVGTGGKPPGSAIRRNFSSSASIPPDVASRASSMNIEAQCTGHETHLFGLDPKDAVHAFEIAVRPDSRQSRHRTGNEDTESPSSLLLRNRNTGGLLRDS